MKIYIGDNIKALRKRNKLTQKELAARCGVSDKLVCSWEVNRTEPKAAAVQKMLQIFDCTIEELCGQVMMNLSYNECMLISKIRMASTAGKKEIFDFVDSVAERERENK